MPGLRALSDWTTLKFRMLWAAVARKGMGEGCSLVVPPSTAAEVLSSLLTPQCGARIYISLLMLIFCCGTMLNRLGLEKRR